MHKVLITKELTKKQEAIAHDYGLEPIEQPFIKVTLEYDTIESPSADVWIFTSSNASRYMNVHFQDIPQELYPSQIVCIGPATAEPLRNTGIPIEMPDYGTAENVVKLVKSLGATSAVFFSGNLRSNTIPEGLQDELDFTEFQVYQTELLDKAMNMEEIEAVAFFSPSGVKGFAQSNTITKQKVISVGTMTRKTVEKKFDIRSGIAASPSVDDVLFALKEVLGL